MVRLKKSLVSYNTILCSPNKIRHPARRDVFSGNATGFVYARNK